MLVCAASTQTLVGRASAAGGSAGGGVCRFYFRHRSGLVALVVNVHHGPTEQARFCHRVHVYRQAERAVLGIFLYELQLLEEKRGRLHNAALGAPQVSGGRVDQDAALEQSRTLLFRLDLENVRDVVADNFCALVAELVVFAGDGGESALALLHVVNFRLQQAGDDVGLHKSIADKLDGHKRQRARCAEIAAQLVLAVLGAVRQVGLNDGVVTVGPQFRELLLGKVEISGQRQLTDLGAYSDLTVIEADLPTTAQHGRYELRRRFAAPKSLAFAAIRFAGDGFVKTNIIARLLQSEVDHVQKGEGASTAITAANYKFSFKGIDSIGDRAVYAYQLKPRKKRNGLFKGRIFLDVFSGRLRRAEGVLVKSPSFFVKRVEFVQDYEDVAGFSLPARVHSVSKTRLFGRAVVDISHTGYEAKPLTDAPADGSSAPAASPGSN